MQLYAFDILALGGEDERQLPLEMRKTNLARLLRGRPDGMFVAPVIFASRASFSKRRDRCYIAGRTKDWIKVKNRTHPAIERKL